MEDVVLFVVVEFIFGSLALALELLAAVWVSIFSAADFIAFALAVWDADNFGNVVLLDDVAVVATTDFRFFDGEVNDDDPSFVVADELLLLLIDNVVGMKLAFRLFDVFLVVVGAVAAIWAITS